MLAGIIQLGEYANTIAKHHAISTNNMVVEDMCHKPMKSTWRGAETKRTADKLIMTLSRHKGSLVQILSLDIELVKSTVQIDLGEKLGALCSCNEILSGSRRESVSNGLGIQCSVMHTQTQTSVLLGCKQNWCTILREAVPNDARMEQVTNLQLELRHMLCRHLVQPIVGWA